MKTKQTRLSMGGFDTRITQPLLVPSTKVPNMPKIFQDIYPLKVEKGTNFSYWAGC